MSAGNGREFIDHLQVTEEQRKTQRCLEGKHGKKEVKSIEKVEQLKAG